MSTNKIKIIIAGGVIVKNLPSVLMTRIKEELMFDNPKYKQALKTGRYIHKIDPYVYYYAQRGSNTLLLPRGYLNRLTSVHIRNTPHELIDRTIAPKIYLEFTGKLRPYQKTAVDIMLERRYGILEAATGSGKTVCGVAITVERACRTLVIMHNKELLNQWKEAFKKFTNLTSVGTIGGGKFDVHPKVTIGIINSVHNKIDRLKNEFGLVIYDECHRTLGNTWVQVINTLKPRYHLGLSATPYRSDGLTKALYSVVGPKLHKVDRGHLERIGAVMVPDVHRISTHFNYVFKNDYSTMLSQLTQDSERNKLIADHITDDYKDNQQPIMVVSDRVSHCENIIDLLENKKNIKPVILNGKQSKKYREQAVKDLKAGKYNILIATASLLGEGFDAPDLSAVFLATPMKFSGRVIQTIGRVLRPSDGSKPRVYDFRDQFIDVLRFSGFARDRIYKSHGWK